MNTHYLTHMPEEWEAIARIFAALGDGTRQKMLLLFEAGETITLKTLADILPLSRSAVVHHITVLEQAGLLVARRQGREVGYTLNTSPLINSLENVLDYAKNLGPTPVLAINPPISAIPTTSANAVRTGSAADTSSAGNSPQNPQEQQHG